MVCEGICAVSLQHRVICTMSGEIAHGVFVQQEPVFPWLKDDFFSQLFSFMWAFLMFYCCVLCNVVSVVLLLVVIVWLNSEFVNFGSY